MSAPTPSDLEAFYSALSDAIDTVGPQRESLMLAKLALLLAHELGDCPRAHALIAEACLDL
jgi:hypothetical protein